MENNNVSEFFKLDPVDKKTLFWLMDNKPEEVKSWIRFVARQYSRNEGVKLDAERLYDEVKIEIV